MKTVKLRPMEEVLAQTSALCPVCLRTGPANNTTTPALRRRMGSGPQGGRV